MKGVYSWIFHRASGVVLLAGLCLHFYTMHYSGHEALYHEAVKARLAQPLWLSFYSLFLISAVYHAMHGLWGIAIEYIRDEMARRAAGAIILLVSFVVASAGIYILSIV